MATVQLPGLTGLAGKNHTVNASLADIQADLALGAGSLLLTNAAKYKTVNVTDSGSANAVDLLAIDALVAAQIKFASLTTVTGSPTDVANLFAAHKSKTVAGLTKVAVTLSAGAIDAEQLLAVDKITSGTITVAGPATLSGSLKDLDKILKAKATAIALPTGVDLVVTDTSITSASQITLLLALASKTTGSIDASALTSIKGSAAKIAELYAAGVDNLDNSTIILTGGSAEASQLLDIDAGTDGDVDATAVKTIKGSAAEVADVFEAAQAGTITGLAGNAKASLSGTTADAADLLTIDAGTTAKLAVKLQSLTGTAEDVAAVYQANSAKTITGLGKEQVTLVGPASVADLNAINAATSGQIDASDVTVLIGTLGQITAVLATPAAQISGLGSQDALLSDTSLTTAQLEALDALTSGDISAPNLLSLTGTLAELADWSEVGTTGTTLTLTDSSVSAAELLALAAIGNPVNANSVATLTGSLADILAAQAAANVSLANLSINVNGEVAATYLLALDAGSQVIINASGVTTLTGSLADIATALGANGISGLSASALSYKVQDSITNLLAADANAQPLQNAIQVTANGHAGALTLAQQASLTDLVTDGVWSYDIQESVANLLNPANAVAIDGAVAVSVTGNAAGTLSIANQIALTALTTDDSWTYSIQDSATNLLNPANAGIIGDAAVVSVTGNAAGTLSLDDYATLTGLTTVDTWSYSIQDSAQNLLDHGNVAPIIGAQAVTVTGNAAGTLSLDDHASLTGLTTVDTWTYSIQDSAQNLLDHGNVAPIVGAQAVTVTGNAAGTLSVAEHATLTGLTTVDTWTFSIVDTASNLLVTGVAAAIGTAQSVTIHGDAAGTLTVAQYNILNALSPRTPDNDWSYSLSDTVANLVAANGDILSGADSVTLTGDGSDALTVAQAALLGAPGSFNNYTLLDTEANLWDGATVSPYATGVVVNISGGVTLAGLTAIDAANGNALVNYGTITGSAADLFADALTNDGTGTYVTGSHPVVVTGNPSVLQLNTINTATTGLVTASISGTATELSQLIPDAFNAYTITVTGAPTLAQLLQISQASTLALQYQSVTGTAAELAANAVLANGPGKFVTGNHDVVVTDPATVLQLNSINQATTGVVTASVTGTIAELWQLVEGVNAYTITINDTAATVEQLKKIDGATSIAVNATALTSITGSDAELLELLAAKNAGTINLATDVDFVITGTATISTVKALIAASSGEITASLSGTYTDLQALYSAPAVVEQNLTITLLDTDNGAVTPYTDIERLTGTTSELINATALTHIGGFVNDFAALYDSNNADYIGDQVTLAASVNASVNGSLSVAQANTIAGYVGGTVSATIDAGQTVAQLLSLNGTHNYSITVPNELGVTASNLIAIDGKTSLVVNAQAITSLIDTAATLTTLLAAASGDADAEPPVAATIDLNDAINITVTDAQAGTVGVALVNGFNALTTGTITATLSGTTAELGQLTAGNNVLTLTTADTAADAANLLAMDAATTVAVNLASLNDISGRATELLAIVAAATANPATLVISNPAINFTLTGPDPVAPETVVTPDTLTVAQANILDAFTAAPITATLSDTDASVLAGLLGSNAYTIHVVGEATTLELADINAATTVIVDGSGLTLITGTADSMWVLYGGNGSQITLPPDVNLTANDVGGSDAIWVEGLQRVTEGVATATLIPHTASYLNQHLHNSDTDQLTITVTDAATLAELRAVDAKTALDLNLHANAVISGTLEDWQAFVEEQQASAEPGADGVYLLAGGNYRIVVTDAVVNAEGFTFINQLAALTSGPVTATVVGSVTDLAALTDTNVNNYTIDVTGAASIAQLTALKASTTGNLTYDSVADSAANLLADANSNNGNGTFVTASTDVEVTDTPTVTQLNAINNATTGVVTATISGTAAQLGQLTPGNNNYTVTINDAASLTQLDIVQFAIGSNGTMHYSAIRDSVANLLDGDNQLTALADEFVKADTALQLTDAVTVEQAIALGALTTGLVTASIVETDAATLATLPASTDLLSISLVGAATATQVIAIEKATAAVVTATGLTSLSGSHADVQTVLAFPAGQLVKPTNFAVSIDAADVLTAAQANALDAANGTGLVEASVTGAISALLTLTGTGHSYTLTFSDTSASAADLLALDGKTVVDISIAGLTHITVSATNWAAFEAALTAETLDGMLANVAFTVPSPELATVALLNDLRDATTGTITATAAGTFTQLSGLTADANNQYSLTVTDATLTAAQIAILNGITAPLLTVEADTVSGSGIELTALLSAAAADPAEVSLKADVDFDVTSGASVALLNALNASTTGTVSASLTDTAANLLGLAGPGADGSVNDYDLTVSDAATLAQLADLDALTDGDLGYSQISDTSANLFTANALSDAAADYIDGNVNVTVTGDTQPTVDQLNALADAADGIVTASISGTAAALATSLQTAGTDAISITLTGAATLAQLATLDGKTSVTVAVSTIADTAAHLFDGNNLSDAALDYIAADVAVVVTGLLNAAQAAALVAQTTGLVTANVRDTAANLSALLSGSDALTVNVTSAATLAQAAAIDAATTGTIHFDHGLTGTALELYNDARLNNGTGVYVSGNVPVTVDPASPATALQLNAINQATTGLVTASITGTAEELVWLVASNNAYTITVTGSATPEQLLIISQATALPLILGTITGTAGDDVLDFSAFTQAIIIDGLAGNDTITGTANFADSLFGGDGDDTIVINSNANGQTFSGGAGTDALVINSTAINLTASSVTGFESIVLNEGARATVNMAQALLVTAGSTGDYDLVASSTELLNAANATAIAAADSITLSTTSLTLTVAQHNTLAALDITNAWTYSITDSAANLLGADPAVLSGAGTVLLSGDVAANITVAQIATLGALVDNATWTYSLLDSAANLLANAAAAGNATAVALTNTAVVNLSAANFTTLNGWLGGTWPATGYSLTDTWTNLSGYASDANRTVLDGATSITVTTAATLTADQAALLGEDYGTLMDKFSFEAGYSITSTYADYQANSGDISWAAWEANRLTITEADNSLSFYGEADLHLTTAANMDFQVDWETINFSSGSGNDVFDFSNTLPQNVFLGITSLGEGEDTVYSGGAHLTVETQWSSSTIGSMDTLHNFKFNTSNNWELDKDYLIIQDGQFDWSGGGALSGTTYEFTTFEQALQYYNTHAYLSAHNELNMFSLQGGTDLYILANTDGVAGYGDNDFAIRLVGTTDQNGAALTEGGLLSALLIAHQYY